MKLLAQIFLIIFITFLVTPAIVTLIEKKCDVSVFYKFSEEEQVLKEVKIFPFYDNVQTDFLVITFKKSSLVLSENLSKHDNISAKIFSPPPDMT